MRSHSSGCLLSPIGQLLFISTLEAGGRAWGGLTSASTRGPVGILGGLGPRALAILATGRGWGVARAWAGVAWRPRHSQQGARADGPAGLLREPETPVRRQIRSQACRLQVSQGPDLTGNGGGAASPASSGKKAQPAAPAFPPPRVRGFRVAEPPAPPRLARCLFVSPRLPSSQTNGCWQEIGSDLGEPRSSARRGGAPRSLPAPGAPSPGGGCFDI